MTFRSIAILVFTLAVLTLDGRAFGQICSGTAGCGAEICCQADRDGDCYSPDDPWLRGRWWLRQTGHFGRFYNCDCEEQKRFSPCIIWKRGDDPCNIGRVSNWLRCDVQRIKQRIIDGSSECCGDRRKRTPAASCHCGAE